MISFLVLSLNAAAVGVPQMWREGYPAVDDETVPHTPVAAAPDEPIDYDALMSGADTYTYLASGLGSLAYPCGVRSRDNFLTPPAGLRDGHGPVWVRRLTSPAADDVHEFCSIHVFGDCETPINIGLIRGHGYQGQVVWFKDGLEGEVDRLVQLDHNDWFLQISNPDIDGGEIHLMTFGTFSHIGLLPTGYRSVETPPLLP